MPCVLLIMLLATAAALLLFLLLQRNRTLRRLQQREQMRNGFFQGLVHEFRTPLHIIQGLSRHLRELNQTGNNSNSYLGAIERQGRILNNLTNRLQEVTGLETSDTPHAWKRGNIVAFLEMVAESFLLISRKKGVELVFFSEETLIETDFHPSHLQQTLQILLLKALESSHEGARIFLIVERHRRDKRKFTIKVIDHGNGIEKKELTTIFEPSFKEGDTGRPTSIETGLVLCKHLVSQLQGTIRVNSREGRGTTFSILLPIRNDKVPTSSSQIPPSILYESQKEITDTEVVLQPDDADNPEINENDPREKILLVEENNDTALYIKTLFNPNRYILFTTPGCSMALELAQRCPPDIVIADCNVSQKNGLELCSLFRTSPLLNHIPVIILSARNGAEERLEALQSGADAYLSKPFRAEELQIRVEKLLESRSLLREKYQRAQPVGEKINEMEGQHLDFMRQVTDIIHREIRNQEFSPKMLADELAISLSQLNRRLNNVTGKPSSTYILQVKMAHARKILASRHKSIGEVAAECGIYDVNYFSRIFKKHTGVTPTHYQRLSGNYEG